MCWVLKRIFFTDFCAQVAVLTMELGHNYASSAKYKYME